MVFYIYYWTSGLSRVKIHHSQRSTLAKIEMGQDGQHDPPINHVRDMYTCANEKKTHIPCNPDASMPYIYNMLYIYHPSQGITTPKKIEKQHPPTPSASFGGCQTSKYVPTLPPGHAQTGQSQGHVLSDSTSTQDKTHLSWECALAAFQKPSDIQRM